MTFAPVLQWHLAHGMALILPDVVCLARLARSEEPERKFVEQPDSLFVEYLSYEGKGVHHLFRIYENIVPRLQYLIYKRGFRDGHQAVVPFKKIKQVLART